MIDKALGKVYLTPKEAALYLRRSPSTLSDWRVAGIGPRYFKVGPHKKAPVLYYRHDLDIWLAQYSVVTTPEIFNVKVKK